MALAAAAADIVAASTGSLILRSQLCSSHPRFWLIHTAVHASDALVGFLIYVFYGLYMQAVSRVECSPTGPSSCVSKHGHLLTVTLPIAREEGFPASLGDELLPLKATQWWHSHP